MNRGRRRGGGVGLAGLRDGVKRRLFDPNAVPTKPDVKTSLSRLVPLAAIKTKIHSILTDAATEDAANSSSFQNDKSKESVSSTLFDGGLVELEAAMEFAFRSGPHYHSVPRPQEGIKVHCETGTTIERSDNPVSLIHLLMCHKHIDTWGDGALYKDMQLSTDWYPEELLRRVRKKKKAAPQSTTAVPQPTTKAKRSRERRRKNTLTDTTRGLEDLVSDEMLFQVTEATNADDTILEPAEADVGNDEIVAAVNDEDADSEDDRWDGAVPEGDGDDVDDEEHDNDYCQNYFDNGEADFSDPGDDDNDGSARYFD